MVEELGSREDLERFIRKNRIAVVAIAGDDLSKNYVRRILGKLEERSRDLIRAGIVSSTDLDENVKEVLIRMYLDSNLVFEQHGIFWRQDVDYEALRRGIKDVLKRHSIKTLF